MTFTGPFDVGPGWMDICRAAVKKLEEVGATIMQVKEKFGGLRVYIYTPDSFSPADHIKADKIVEEAEIMASWTCMRCGEVESDVRIRVDDCGWMVGYCQACFDNWNKENKEED